MCDPCSEARFWVQVVQAVLFAGALVVASLSFREGRKNRKNADETLMKLKEREERDIEERRSNLRREEALEAQRLYSKRSEKTPDLFWKRFRAMPSLSEHNMTLVELAADLPDLDTYGPHVSFKRDNTLNRAIRKLDDNKDTEELQRLQRELAYFWDSVPAQSNNPRIESLWKANAYEIVIVIYFEIVKFQQIARGQTLYSFGKVGLAKLADEVRRSTA